MQQRPAGSLMLSLHMSSQPRDSATTAMPRTRIPATLAWKRFLSLSVGLFAAWGLLSLLTYSGKLAQHPPEPPAAWNRPGTWLEPNKAAQQGGAEHQQLWVRSNSSAGPSMSGSQVTQSLLPKVALLFIAPYGIDNEALWLSFFEGAAAWLPPSGHLPSADLMPPSLKATLGSSPSFNITATLQGGSLHPPINATALRSPNSSTPPDNCTAAVPQCHTFGCALHRLLVRQPKAQPSRVLVPPHRLRPGARPAAWEGSKVDTEVDRLMSARNGPAVYARQRLFSAYVHTQPWLQITSESVFAGREIPWRVNLTRAWGQPTLMQAARLLLRAALIDPLNLWFVLLSESTIPLVPAPLVWAQLLSERHSRVDACRDVDMDPLRWRAPMSSSHLKQHHWRKSSQWWAVHREHAALAVMDSHVSDLFEHFCQTHIPRCPQQHAQDAVRCKRGRKHRFLPATLVSWVTGGAGSRCSNGSGHAEHQEYDPVCVSDEHYMPTLLASYGLDSETDCLGLATLSDWAHARGGHPSSFLPADLSPGLAVELKSQHTTGGKLRSDLPACDWEQAWASAAGGIFAAQPTLQATPNTPATHAPAHEQVRHWVLATGYRGVRSRCALFGRKFPGRSLFTYQAVTRPQDAEQVERATLQWALSCSVGLGLGPWCPLNQHHHAGAEARS